MWRRGVIKTRKLDWEEKKHEFDKLFIALSGKRSYLTRKRFEHVLLKTKVQVEGRSKVFDVLAALGKRLNQKTYNDFVY